MMREESHGCRGIVPAFTGSAFGHGVRTCAYEASLQGLTSLSGGAAELQASLSDCCQHVVAIVIVWLIRMCCTDDEAPELGA